MKRRFQPSQRAPFLILPVLGLFLVFMSSCAVSETVLLPSVEPVPPLKETVSTESIPETSTVTRSIKTLAPIEGKKGSIPTLEVEEKPEEMIALEPDRQESQEDRVTYDIPITINKKVQKWLTYYVGPGRRSYARALARSGLYLPMMKRVFREKGLPEDLVYLSMIESHFVVTAYSRARASGLWQFIPSTARIYGLSINEWVDERRSPEKSTRAAANFLSHLYEKFGSWYLAAAAYNAGEGKIRKSLKKYKATTFWDLTKKRRLKLETRQYVPKFLAALLIAKDPEFYGFYDIKYEPPLAYDEVVVSHPTSLTVIARLSGCDVKVIRKLNPGLKQWCTPMKERNYKIWVPKGAGKRFRSRYAVLKPDERITMARHKVVWGETLGSIAQLYGTSVRTIKNFNSLKSDRIYKGSTVRIPVGATKYYAVQKKYQKNLAGRKSTARTTGRRITYTVRTGDNPWQIARRYDLHWRDIAFWNNIKNVRRLKPGQKLVLYLKKPEASTVSAKKTSQPIEMAKAGSGAEGPVSYTVRSGDTLWGISRRFNVRIARLRYLNNLRHNLIKPGDVLTLGTEKI